MDSCSVKSLNLKANNDLYVNRPVSSRSLLDWIKERIKSNSIGLKVHEILDQDISIVSYLLIVLIQWGILQMRVLLISGEEEL